MVRAILTDIEGTTSSISFVHDVLFPYARAHMGEFVRLHGDDPAVQMLLDDVRREAGGEPGREQLVAQLMQWIDEDRKVTPLKALQGLIWEHGYHAGDFRGHVYPDAEKWLRAWQAQGLRLYVFSSGSVHAQKLLFGHTEFGDLTPLFSGYFDTNVGNKREPGAYLRIAESIGLPPTEVLFLSDIGEELDAARAAGMHTTWLVRDDRPRADAPHPQVSEFGQIRLD